jgi:hypothetical protein
MSLFLCVLVYRVHPKNIHSSILPDYEPFLRLEITSHDERIAKSERHLTGECRQKVVGRIGSILGTTEIFRMHPYFSKLFIYIYIYLICHDQTEK